MFRTFKPLNFAELRIANVERQALYTGCEDWNTSDWYLSLVGETGELGNLLKKIRRGDDIDIKEVGKEIADIVTYADILATHLGLDLGECVREKFNEVSDRKKIEIKL